MEIVYNKKRINREIIHLMVPIVLENTLQLVAGIVTTAMVGRLLADDIAAQGISNIVYRVFFALFRGLSIGATVVVATYYGKGEYAKCRRLIEQAYLTAIPVVMLAITIATLFSEQILSIFTDDRALVALASDYTRVLFWAVPFMAIICFNTASLNGHGDTKTPMFIAGILNIVNVIAGYILIFGIGSLGGFGIMGAAYSTIISQFTGASIGLYVLYRKRGIFRRTSHGRPFISFDIPEIKNYFSIGMPAAMEFLFWNFSAIVMSMVLLSYGNNYYAAYQLGLQAEMLTDMPAQGFVVAATTLAAKAIGQMDSNLYKIYFTQLRKMALIISIFATIMVFSLPRQLMMVLTNNPELQRIGASYIFLMGFAQLPQVLSRVYNGFIRSSGGKRVPMYITFTGIWLVRVPLVVLFGWILRLDINFIWMAIVADQILRISVSIIYTKRKNVYNYVDQLALKEGV
ncbi:MAG: MATE family efflux transporter [Defluviitaleaceae bacterium]|nr:MATE family efflux transporter [Defluviitaleaceae bacterium]